MKMAKKMIALICLIIFLGFIVLPLADAKGPKNPSEIIKEKWKSLNPPVPKPPVPPQPPSPPEPPVNPKKPKLTGPPTLPVPPVPPEIPKQIKGPKGPSGPAGKSHMGHLYLYEKIEPTPPYPPATPWEIVEDGAWGKMTYQTSGMYFSFVFNGHKLEQGLEYTLLYYPDPWPGEGLICLGTGTVNEEGDVHIKAAVETCGDLPMEGDWNHPGNINHKTCIEESTCIEGAKIWLVLSADVDCDNQIKMIGWNPKDYLFEHVGITYKDTYSECEPPATE
jgi:hypothetical protein